MAKATQPEGFLENTFKLTENKTSVRTEVIAGVTTFMTMAYIIFVNPSILSGAGMPFNAVLFATVASTVVATLLMAFLANYPFALAPGMGLNAYFAAVVTSQANISWETALGAVFISGVVFILLTLTKIREMIIDAVPDSVKAGIAAGIGLFIAFIGLKNAGIDMNTATFAASLRDGDTALAAVGLLITGGLLARRVRGGILWGILITAALGLPFGITQMPKGIIQWPAFAEWAPVFGKLDIGAALGLGFLEVVFVFLFVDMFDTVGTLIGVSKKGGFLDKEGKLPRANRALLSDAIGTVVGSIFGTPTVTTYVESASGVAAGGRTGLTSLTVAALFVLSLFFLPIVGVVPAAATAPALILVGAMMISAIRGVPWDDMSEAIPAFVAMAAMPFSFSIANGIALGFITYPVIKTLAGKGKEVRWLVWVLAILFVLRFIYLGA